MSALALSLMLAVRPTVAVEVHADPLTDAASDARRAALRGWLVRRLLEEGYAVASDPSHAHGVVRVWEAGDGLVVEAEGGRDRRSYAVEGGPAAVQRLEVLHRALLGVEQTCAMHEALAHPEPSLAVRFIDGTSDDALLEALATVTLDAGVTLSTRPSPGDMLACIEHRGPLAQAGLGPATDGCGPPRLVVDLGDGSDAAQRLAAQYLVDAMGLPPPEEPVLDVATLGGPPAADLEATAGPPTPPREREELGPLQGPPRAQLRLGASAGVASRGPAIDPLFQAGWRMGKIDGLGGRLSVSMIPSAGRSIQVLDVRVVIGPDWELLAGRRGHVDLAVLVGTDVHAFSTGAGEHTAGDMAFAAEVPVSYSLTLRGATRLSLVLDPGVSTVAWEHQLGLLREGTTSWSRPAWRVGVAVGITHGWRIE